MLSGYTNTRTSLRSAPLEHTLHLLESHMSVYGCTRITDTTRLDTIGIPVFAAIRPHAGKGSVSVTSGKSPDLIAAKVGALAESFELASAMYRPKSSPLIHLTRQEFYERCGYNAAKLPVRASKLTMLRTGTLPPDMTAVACENLLGAGTFLLPSVLAYFPFHSDFGFNLYGMSTNGISSGNSYEEAVLHATLEVVERDVTSFASLGRATRPVTSVDRTDLRELLEAVRTAGIEIEISYLPNEFDLPSFSAYIFDKPESGLPVFVGHGTHIFKDIAIMRACTEAIQSRLTHIHGARDDILDYHKRWTHLSWTEKQQVAIKLRAQISVGVPIAFHDIPDAGSPISISQALDLVKNRLASNGLTDILVYRYKALIPNFCAVRVVVPGLEFYSSDRFRIGDRILAYVKNRS